jgi:acetylornithine aminotransferase
VSHVLRCSGYDLIKTDIVRAKGCYLYDAQGQGYLDLESGVWCTALGHSHPRIVRLLQAQSKRLMHLAYRYSAPEVEAAAEAVLDVAGMEDGRCLFLSSGSEAVEFGVQVARRLSERPLLLTLSDAYLAAYGSAGRKSPAAWHTFDRQPCAACGHAETCDPACKHLQSIPFDRIGGFVFEPGNSSGLVRLPPKGLLEALARRVRSQGGLVVVDEVTTGLGRTGAWFGYQHYGLQPDIVALGKGLGNGYPVSAVALTEEVAARLMATGFHYAQSHQNDPLGCAVAREVVNVLREEELIERSAELGKHVLAALTALAAEHAVIKEVRGRGLMIAIELVSGSGHPTAIQLYHRLLERGFIVGCKPVANLLRCYPPLVIGERDMSRFVENLSAILALQSHGAYNAAL